MFQFGGPVELQNLYSSVRFQSPPPNRSKNSWCEVRSLVHREIVVGDAIQSQTIFPRTKRHSRLHPIPLGRVWSISYLFQACGYDAILWYLEDRKPAWATGNSDFSPIRAHFKLEQIHI